MKLGDGLGVAAIEVGPGDAEGIGHDESARVDPPGKLTAGSTGTKVPGHQLPARRLVNESEEAGGQGQRHRHLGEDLPGTSRHAFYRALGAPFSLRP